MPCATLMEASCGTPEADNEMVYDRKHMGHISENKKICRKFPPCPGTQAHRNLRGINKNSRCQGWSKKEWVKFCARSREQQTVNFHMPKRRFRRLIWTVLGFFAFWQRNHQTRSKTKSPSDKRPCTFLETKDTLFRHFLITVSFIPTLFLVSFALQPSHMTISETRQRPKTTKKIIKSEAFAKQLFFTHDLFDLVFPQFDFFPSFRWFLVR